MAGTFASVAALALAGCMTSASVAAWGQADARHAAEPIPFDIPAEPLQAALEQFMTVTAHSGLYDSTVTAGLFSAPVKGTMAPEAALRQLVAGTGLKIRYATEDTFSIVPGPPVIPAAKAAADSAPWREQDAKANYFGILQAAVKNVFCRNPSTAPDGYRVALSLWVGASGAVENVRLLDTSGSRERDAQLTQGLRALELPALPADAGIRQPITMVILPAVPGAVGDCSG